MDAILLRTTNKVNYRENKSRMTVTFNGNMNSKVGKLKSSSDEFLYNFPVRPRIQSREYIASPMPCKDNNVTFLKTMKLSVLIGQCFGLNPVLGICSNNANKLRFSYYSGRCFYTILSILGQTILLCFCVLKIFKDADAPLSSNTVVVFYGCNCLITIQFLNVAKKWPRLCRHIAKIEAIDPNDDNTVVKKCNISCIMILLLGAVEHGLSDLSAVTQAVACQPEKATYDAYLSQNFPWVWDFLPYNTLLGMISKFLCVQCTFNWNFSDSFIICVCLYLTSRIQQVNNRIKSLKGQLLPYSFWRIMREDYTKATNLVRQVDDVVSGIIFVSFASNLFSICFLLLHTLETGFKPTISCPGNTTPSPFAGYEHASYFIFSIVFLIIRSLAVSLIAARVNSASCETVYALYEVPSSSYCVEVQRFIDQIHGDTVVLSGLQFFSVKRGIVLTIAATIVTYELVLIQFTGVNPSQNTYVTFGSSCFILTQ